MAGKTGLLSSTNPAKATRDARIAIMRASGKTHEDIAAAENLHRTTVSRILTNKQCQKIIDEVTRINIAHAKGINRKFLKHCYSDDAKISLDAIKQWQKTVGISPSNAPTQNVLNIISVNTAENVLDQRLQHLMAGAMGGLLDDPDVVDAEVMDDSSGIDEDER